MIHLLLRYQPVIWRATLFTLFSVVLLSACSKQSDPTTTVRFSTPKGLVATAGARTVVLNWSGVPGASGYTVYWSNSANVSSFTSAAVNTEIPYFEHTGLANNMTYYYVVTAHTHAGESGQSAEVNATPQALAPEKPVLQVKAEDTRVTLRWASVIGGLRYSLYWSTQPNVSSADNYIEKVTVPFVHSGLTNGQDYYYILVADNGEGLTTLSDEVTVKPQKALPTAPIITQVTSTPGKITLTWQDVGNAETFDLFWNTQGNVTDADAYIEQVTSSYTHAPIPVAAGQSYYYRLRARNNAGVSTLSNEVQVTLPDTVIIPPQPAVIAAPAGLNVTLQDQRLTLDWNPVAGALGYNLYWKSSAGGVTKTDQKIANIQPPYTHTGLTNGTSYFYRVSAINNDGESVLSSDEIFATPQVIVPGVPAGVQAVGGDQRITVSWIDVEGAAGYKVYVDSVGSPNATSPYVINALTNGNTLTNGQTYKIQVSAVNSAQESALSTPVVEVTPHEPLSNAPTQVSAIPGNGQVTVQWNKAVPQNPADPAEAITDYKVYYATHTGVNASNGTLITGVSWNEDQNGQIQIIHSLLNDGQSPLQNGQRYYYVVTALNAGGESRASVEVWARPQVSIPGAPGNPWTLAGDNQVTINFTPVSNVAAPTYNLYWTKALTAGQRTITQVISNIQPGYIFTDGVNANGNTYFFQLSAFNDGGESPKTIEISAIPQVPPPQIAPKNILAAAQDSAVALTWDAVSDATAGYAIYWSTDSNIDPTTSARLSGTDVVPGYIHKPLQNGQTYYYQIVAINAGGESPLSDSVIAQPQVPPPATPTAWSATAGNTVVTLQWTPSATASGYQLFYHTNNTDPIALWSTLNGVLPGYSHTGLNNGQVYYYRLVALNPGGASALTPIINATPIAPIPGAPQGLAAAAGDAQVSLNWFTQPGLTYTLYWSTDVTIVPINSGNSLTGNDIRPTYVHTGLSNTSIYRYQLTASNSSGESLPSVIVVATPALEVPGAPIALSAEAGNQQVTLRWFAPAGATAATQYTLYWSNTADQGTSGTPLLNVTSPYVQTNLNNGQDYYYVITATTAGSVSPVSNQAIAQPFSALPATPSNITVASGNNQNVLSWSAVGNANQYLIEWSLDATLTTTVQSTNVFAPATQFVHSNLVNGDTVYYRVTAQNADGNSPVSAIVSGTPQANQPVNNPPVFTAAPLDQNNNDGDIILPLTVSASDADNNTVIFSATGLPPGISINATSGVISGQIAANASATNPYTVVLTADDQTNTPNAKITASFNWTVNSAPLAAPTGLVAVASANSIDLSWNLIAGQTYNIYRSTSAGIDISIATPIVSNQATATYFDTTVLPGQDLFYVVTAVEGDKESSASNEVSVMMTIVNQKLIGISDQDGLLVDVDSLSGKVTPISGHGLAGFKNVKHIAYDNASNIIYGINTVAGAEELIEINAITGQAKLIGIFNAGFSNSVGLAYDSGQNILYDLRVDGDLFSLNPATLQSNFISNIGYFNVNGLAIDSNLNTLYTISIATNQLVEIGLLSGLGKVINVIAAGNNISHLVNDPNTNLLLGLGSFSDFGGGVVTIDKSSAAVTVIGGVANTIVGLALAVDSIVPTNSVLYSVNGSNLVRINLPDFGGVKVRNIPRPFSGIGPLVYDASLDLIYAYANQNSGFGNLVAIDPNTGQGSIKNLGILLGYMASLAMDPASPNVIYAANNTNLYSISTVDWSVTDIGPLGTNIFQVQDMAFDSTTGILYGLTGTELLTIDIATGSATKINSITDSQGNIVGLNGLAVIVTGSTSSLYGIVNNQLITIDKLSAVVTPIGAPLSVAPLKLTARANSLFSVATTSSNSDLVSIDATTQAAAIVGSFALSGDLVSMAYDSSSGLTYAMDQLADKLFTLDANTGVVDQIGVVGVGGIQDVAFDVANNKLYGLSSAGSVNQLVEISTIKSMAPLGVGVMSFNTNTIAGIAFDDAGGLFAVDNTIRQLISVTIGTPGSTTAVVPYNTTQLGALTYDGKLKQFIAYDYTFGQLISMDIATTTSKSLGKFGFNRGLSFDSSSNTLFYVPTSTDIASNQISITTFPAITLGNPSLRALAFNPDNNVVYGVSAANQLISINSTSGTLSVLGDIGFYDVNTLVYDNFVSPAVLYGIDNTLFQLIKIDVNTGAAVAVGVPMTNFIQDLTIDRATGIIYGSTGSGLVEVNKSTGQTIPVGSFLDLAATPVFINGIAIDSVGNMYGVVEVSSSENLGQLYAIDKTTAVASYIGVMGFEQIQAGLTMDTNNDTLFAYAGQIQQLLSVNTTTGAGTTIGSITPYINNLTYDAVNNITYGVTPKFLVGAGQTSGDLLYSINTVNGTSTFVGETSPNVKGNKNGLAFNGLNGNLYTVSTTNELVEFDVTGQAINAAAVSGIYITGLEFNPNNNNLLYAIDNTARKLINFTDTSTGAWSEVSANSIGFGNYNSLIYSSANDIFFSSSNNQLVLIDPVSGVGYKTIDYSGITFVHGLLAQP